MVFASCFVGDFRGGEMGEKSVVSVAICSAKPPEMLEFLMIWR